MPSFDLVLRAMIGCLPFLCLALTIYSTRKDAGVPFSAVASGALLWAFSLVVVSNVLSWLGIFDFSRVLAFWLLYLFVALPCAYHRGVPRFSLPARTGLLLFLTAVAALTLVTALLYPPNTSDSMGYHMPKIMYWLQHASMGHYYTSDLRQTGLSPFAEMVIFHTVVLSGQDYLANLVQWSAFVGNLFLAASTASLLGGGKTASTLAAIFFATLPMGLSQATGTQTDMTVAFWLSCLANRFLVWRRSMAAVHALHVGLAVGLAILTKGTGYVISLPFAALFAFLSLRHWRKLLAPAILAGFAACLLFTPPLYRNYVTYGNLSAGVQGNIVHHPHPGTLIANVLANILSNDPALVGKTAVEHTYSRLLPYLKADSEKIFPYGPLSERVKLTTNEDYAQNPLHTLLLLGALTGFGLAFFPTARTYRYLIIAVCTLFCLLLAWQPWVTRLQVPLFALAAPLVGLAWSRLPRPAGKILGGVLILGCLPSLFWTPSRPLVPVPASVSAKRDIWRFSREDFYFANARQIQSDYIQAVELLVKEEPESIGWYGSSFEYPLWALLKSRVKVMPRIEHLRPGIWRQKTTGTSQPQYVFVLDSLLPQEKGPPPDRHVRLFKLTDSEYVRIF